MTEPALPVEKSAQKSVHPDSDMLEQHRSGRTSWLRAAVLGANDGILSTASLIVGVAAADAGRAEILLAAIAGLGAGAMSMAAGEYVSVSSQADTEQADLEMERKHIAVDAQAEHDELAAIYVDRGLQPELAQEVATQLMRHDALGAHARDELGFSATTQARPVQAAVASACAFAFGGALPLLLGILVPLSSVLFAVAGGSLLFLAVLGALAARAGGASMLRGAARVSFWGTLAMAVTAGLGAVFGRGVGG